MSMATRKASSTAGIAHNGCHCVLKISPKEPRHGVCRERQRLWQVYGSLGIKSHSNTMGHLYIIAEKFTCNIVRYWPLSPPCRFYSHIRGWRPPSPGFAFLFAWLFSDLNSGHTNCVLYRRPPRPDYPPRVYHWSRCCGVNSRGSDEGRAGRRLRPGHSFGSN